MDDGYLLEGVKVSIAEEDEHKEYNRGYAGGLFDGQEIGERRGIEKAIAALRECSRAIVGDAVAYLERTLLSPGVAPDETPSTAAQLAAQMKAGTAHFVSPEPRDYVGDGGPMPVCRRCENRHATNQPCPSLSGFASGGGDK